jgi:hypothetical protein
VNKKGFLLFEVIMSIVIITAGLLFITRSYSSSKMSVDRSGEIFRTSLLLESKMWEYEAAEEISDQRESGDFEEAEGYSWEMEAEPVEEGLERPKLSLVTLRVFKEKDREATEYSVRTYLKYKFL